jgi:hypothetical protein
LLLLPVLLRLQVPHLRGIQMIWLGNEEEENVIVNEDEIDFESDDDVVLETNVNEDEEETIEP